MRVWLSRENLAARQLTVADVENSLLRENVELPAGRLESTEREFTLRTDTNLRTEEDFRNLVVGRGPDGYLVRLAEVAEVRLAADDDRSISRSNGIIGMSMAIIPQSKANVLATSRAVKQRLAEVQKTLPNDITAEINIDNGIFIAASLKNVVFALSETLVLVLIVIFLFLGTVRATLIPAVTIPVSIIAAAIVMLVLGYSINTLTLLAAVLAIGLVVDDAIVVLENIVRRIEGGEPSALAAINGSHEIGFAVVSTTLVLMAVFVPISFMTGDTGRLFGEFGVTVAAAVGFSAFVALSLTPMMTSRLFAAGMPKSRITGGIDRLFHSLDDRYAAGLRNAMSGKRPLWIVGGAMGMFAVVLLVLVLGVPFSGLKLSSELTPQEDRGFVRIFVTAPEGSSIAYMDRQLRQVEEVAQEEVERGNAKRVITRTGGFGRAAEVNTGMVNLPLNLWDERDDSAARYRHAAAGAHAEHSRRTRQRQPGGQPAVAQCDTSAGHRARWWRLRRDRAVARQDHAARGRGESAHPQSRVRLPGTPAARHRADRSQQGRGPGRVTVDRRPHARNHAGRAHRHHLRARRRGIRRDPAGAHRAARLGG